jgi:acyl-CoA synthetase (AMP-forming)/AMP-acid ligase II
MDEATRVNLFGLSTGAPVSSLSPYRGPVEELCAAFTERSRPFLRFYFHAEEGIQVRSWTRGQFWNLACLAAAFLHDHGLARGDRVLHCFSANSPYDLAFRLGEALLGPVPVTVNWQADTDERLLYKAEITEAKALLTDTDFRERALALVPSLPGRQLLEAKAIEGYQPLTPWQSPEIGWEDERLIIFTSGTTGNPKGVIQPHRCFLTNRLTFEEYFHLHPEDSLTLLMVNPMHHTNSSSMSDWAMRRPGTILHLVERYSTWFWRIWAEIAEEKEGMLVAMPVGRHFDFLENLTEEDRLPLEKARLETALARTEILIGSAPVGPTTVQRIKRWSGRYPHVRFGSTESTMQVLGIPLRQNEGENERAFQAGWEHQWNGQATPGYYIGQEIDPFTRATVVKGIEPGQAGYLQICQVGEPGYLVCQGGELMSAYVAQPEETRSVFGSGWYTGLRDIGFTLPGQGGGMDFYWLGRDSALLIRGGPTMPTSKSPTISRRSWNGTSVSHLRSSSWLWSACASRVNTTIPAASRSNSCQRRKASVRD